MKFFILTASFVTIFMANSAVQSLSISKGEDRVELEDGKVVKDEDKELKMMGGSGECRGQEDCPPGHCCTVGMMRYSIPSCSPLGELDDPCVPASVPQNLTLSYPEEEFRRLTDVYLIVCPCAQHFVCDRSSVSCQPDDKSTLLGNELTK